MKRNYLVILAVVLLSFGCQKKDVPGPDVLDGDGLIALSSGPVLSSRVVVDPNQGIRVEKFVTGDQIGVTAVFSTTPSDNNVTVGPNWAAAMHFDNKPAAFASFADAKSLFNWGLGGAGGVDNGYYPSGARGIYMVSYYPHSAAYTAGDPEGADLSAQQPKLKVVLTDDMVSEGIGDPVYTPGNHLKQADVLHSANYTTSASSLAPFATPMNFRHVLAQIRFTLQREASAGISYFRKIEFLTTKSATLNLADGTMVFGDNAQEASYTFEFKEAAAPLIPVKDATGAPYDIFGGDASAEFNYPMVLPLDEVVGKKSSLKLYTSETADGALSEPITVSLHSLKGFKAGQLNTMRLTISQSVGVVLEATIQPWVAGDTSDLPAEKK